MTLSGIIAFALPWFAVWSAIRIRETASALDLALAIDWGAAR